MLRKNFFDSKWNDEHANEDEIRYCNFFHKASPIKTRNFPIAFFQIVGIFAEDCDDHIQSCYIDDQRFFCDGYYKQQVCNFMHRYGRNDNELIIAKVGFIHKREGKMTELYRVLKKIQKRYKCGKISIENANSTGMRNWCQKNGFVQHPKYENNFIEP